MSFNRKTNTLYLADGGLLETSGLFPKTGSIYAVDIESKVMRSIMHKTLSYPADILYDDNTDSLFVAETYENRVLRLTQKPYGVYTPSVFFQFNGRLGPNSLAMDDEGYLFVARYEHQIVLII